ncbi:MULTISPECIES: amino acid ABC transporter permease [unclassified Pseudomonas]|jgi:polar amino acid transport system permease protein|uniref:amino acid ABC transporter permease n=1 Tax=unclassified Pseudomonas TaxID=196821 RepID=UPI001913A8D9|nr:MULTISPECIES: amino acid ABC transporter permease [unclassified Pseudomonas]MBK5418614.1 amino acid ABC transporter permease [Pseudomonas sp. TH31]MBK5549124.1 amino acid ABC transporter permease [Pseudomonas sp. TH03]MEB0225758.1 amino acid ABC transporter permease [Pseudomonas sp. 5S1]MEB0293445.1 amino acid ABC transporter permease [Pseudomonas sp. 10S4]WPX17355.1 amino acid ABC transporter permease [Pseudomonas sp. 10S4]
MIFDYRIITEHLDDIAQGFAVTLGTWSAGVVLGLFLGLLIAVAQLFGNNLIRAPLRAFIEVIRSTPFLVQLFLVYYGGPSFGLSLEPIPAGVLGLGIYGSVYFAEIFRTGFESVARGQLEAADCLGITRWQCILRIQVPQMLVMILPALVNLVTILCKETAVLSIITIPELTMVMTGIGSQTFAFVETLLVLCIGYLLLVEFCSRLGMYLETRVGRFMSRQAQ